MQLPTTRAGMVTRLAVARAARGVSCASLGAAAGTTATQISCWERGLGAPSAGQWAALALRLSWPLDELRLDDLPESVGWSLAVAGHNRIVNAVRAERIIHDD